MPSPSTTLGTLSPQLTSFLELRYADEMGYIGPQIFPITDVAEQRGEFGVIPIEEIKKQITDNTRAPGSGYKRDTFSFTSKTYTTVERGDEEKVDDNDADKYSNYFDALMFGTSRVLDKLLSAAEKRVADKVMDTTVYTGGLAQSVTAGQWTVATSKPIDDIELAVQKVFTNSGLVPNAIIMNWQVFRILRNNPQVTDRIASSGAGDKSTAVRVSTQQLSECFGGLQVYVAGGIQNTAAPGSAASIAHLWPKHVSVACVATSQDMSQPCIGRTFHWSKDGSMPRGRVETYREEDIRSTIIRARQQTDEMRIYNEAAVLIPSVIA